MSKNRVVEIEILRSIAFISIILQHILGGFLYKTYPQFSVIYLQYLFLTLSRFGVPAFVIISGFASFYGANAASTARQDFKKLKRVVIPYIFWTVFYSIYNVYLNPKSAGSLAHFSINTLFSLLKGDAMYHLWFMILILQFYLLTPLIKLIARHVKKIKWNLSVLIGETFFRKCSKDEGARCLRAFVIAIMVLCQMGLLFLYNNYLPSLYHENGNPVLNNLIMYRDRIFVFWIFYFILGIIAAKNYSKLIKLISKYKIILLVGFIATFLYIAFEGIRHRSFSAAGYSIQSIITSPIYPKMVIYILLEIALLLLLSKMITTKTERMKKLLCTVADNSFRGYLIHPVFVRYFNITINNLFYYQTDLLTILVSFILTVSSTVITAFLLGKIKPLRIILS